MSVLWQQSDQPSWQRVKRWSTLVFLVVIWYYFSYEYNTRLKKWLSASASQPAEVLPITASDSSLVSLTQHLTSAATTWLSPITLPLLVAIFATTTAATFPWVLHAIAVSPSLVPAWKYLWTRHTLDMALMCASTVMGTASITVVYEYGSIQLVQVARSVGPLFTTVWAVLLLDQITKGKPLACLFASLGGTLLASWKEPTMCVMTVLLMSVANSCMTFRNVITRRLLAALGIGKGHHSPASPPRGTNASVDSHLTGKHTVTSPRASSPSSVEGPPAEYSTIPSTHMASLLLTTGNATGCLTLLALFVLGGLSGSKAAAELLQMPFGSIQQLMVLGGTNWAYNLASQLVLAQLTVVSHGMLELLKRVFVLVAVSVFAQSAHWQSHNIIGAVITFIAAGLYFHYSHAKPSPDPTHRSDSLDHRANHHQYAVSKMFVGFLRSFGGAQAHHYHQPNDVHLNNVDQDRPTSAGGHHMDGAALVHIKHHPVRDCKEIEAAGGADSMSPRKEWHSNRPPHSFSQWHGASSCLPPAGPRRVSCARTTIIFIMLLSLPLLMPSSFWTSLGLSNGAHSLVGVQPSTPATKITTMVVREGAAPGKLQAAAAAAMQARAAEAAEAAAQQAASVEATATAAVLQAALTEPAAAAPVTQVKAAGALADNFEVIDGNEGEVVLVDVETEVEREGKRRQLARGFGLGGRMHHHGQGGNHRGPILEAVNAVIHGEKRSGEDPHRLLATGSDPFPTPLEGSKPLYGFYVGWLNHDNLGDEIVADIFYELMRRAIALRAPPAASVTLVQKFNTALQYTIEGCGRRNQFHRCHYAVLGGGSTVDTPFLKVTRPMLAAKRPVLLFGSGYQRIDKNISAMKYHVDLLVQGNTLGGIRGPITKGFLLNWTNTSPPIIGDSGFLSDALFPGSNLTTDVSLPAKLVPGKPIPNWPPAPECLLPSRRARTRSGKDDVAVIASPAEMKAAAAIASSPECQRPLIVATLRTELASHNLAKDKDHLDSIDDLEQLRVPRHPIAVMMLVIEELVNEHHFQVVLQAVDDKSIAAHERYLAMINRRIKPGNPLVTLQNEHLNYTTVMDLYERAAVSINCRLHSGVLSAAALRPTVYMASLPKFIDFMSSIGQDEFMVKPDSRELMNMETRDLAKLLVSKTLNAAKNSAAISTNLQQQRDDMFSKYMTALGELLDRMKQDQPEEYKSSIEECQNIAMTRSHCIQERTVITIQCVKP